MPRLSVVVLSALLGACLALPAAAQWKWRGKDGQIQYSDLPPPAGTSDTDILQRPTPTQRRAAAATAASAASGSITASAKVDPELEAKRKKSEQDEADKIKAENERIMAAKLESCNNAKSYLRTLSDGIRIARTDAKGEREILDDKQRLVESKRTRDIIARDCK